MLGIIERLRKKRIEAVGVCLLWSIVNPIHELRVGELLAEHLPGVACHPVAPAQPDHAGVPARLVDLHRRLAQAADAGYLGAQEARLRAGASPAGC